MKESRQITVRRNCFRQLKQSEVLLWLQTLAGNLSAAC
jgi:hypothetical protein